MNDYELAITRCKQLESLLERGFAAEGKGLHQKVTSVESRLPPALVKRLRFIATIRNKLVHEADYQGIDDRDGFREACDAAERELNLLLRPARQGWLPWLVWILAAALAIALALLLIRSFR